MHHPQNFWLQKFPMLNVHEDDKLFPYQKFIAYASCIDNIAMYKNGSEIVAIMSNKQYNKSKK